jgi:molybdopterin-guanine dinucleotide biosynthesis protein A
MNSRQSPVLGIFVGGKSSRMGVHKAMLHAPVGQPHTAHGAVAVGGPHVPETLVMRAVRIGQLAGCTPVIVGAGEVGSELEPWPRLADDPEGVGPLGGLRALLLHALHTQVEHALVLACDMPYVSASLLQRIAHTESAAVVLAPRDHDTGKWQPLCARYAPAVVLPVLDSVLARGQRSFQTLLSELQVTELSLTHDERAELRDWDTPEDLGAGET